MSIKQGVLIPDLFHVLIPDFDASVYKPLLNLFHVQYRGLMLGDESGKLGHGAGSPGGFQCESRP